MHRPSYSTSMRKGIGPAYPHPAQQQQPPQLTAQQMQQQQLEHQRRAELARRQSKKPTDREIPEELADVIVGDGVQRYQKLRDVERRLDAVMMRKRLDIGDNINKQFARREGILRIWISNTAEGQPWQVIEEGGIGFGEDGTFDFGEMGQATYRVKIEGRLLEDPLEETKDGAEGDGTHADGEKKAGEEDKSQEKKRRPRLSHFFKSITIDFDRNPALQPDGFSAIEWKKPVPTGGPGSSQNYDPNSPEVSFDTLEFERKSDENMNVTINLVRDETTERFKLSPQLAQILDTEEDGKLGAVQGIWDYCRAMGLQEDEDKRQIVCDDTLKKLFGGKEVIYFPYLPELLNPHLQPLPPIKLDYTIRVDKQYIDGTPANAETGEAAKAPSAPTVYDIRVPLPNTLNPQLHRFHGNKSHNQDLQNIIRTDDDLALLVQKIHHTNAKRKFFENLAKDPASFVKRWTASQQRDLEVVLAEATRGGGEDYAGEEFRRGGTDGLWGSEVVRESVGMWLAKNSGSSGKAY